MGNTNPLLSSTQNKLVYDLRTIWQDTVKSAWARDGNLFAVLSQSHEISKLPAIKLRLESLVKTTKKQIAITKKTKASRESLLENENDFFDGLRTCYAYDAGDKNSSGVSVKYPVEHFGWATTVLLEKYHRGDQLSLPTLMKRMKDKTYQTQYKQVLLEDLAKVDTEIAKQQAVLEKQQKYIKSFERKSDFEILNAAYGIGLFEDRTQDSISHYILANEAVTTYLDAGISSESTKIFKDISQLNSYLEAELKALQYPPHILMQLPLECRDSNNEIINGRITADIKLEFGHMCKSAFEKSLSEFKLRLQARTVLLREAQSENLAIDFLNKLELDSIAKTLEFILPHENESTNEKGHLSLEKDRVTKVYQSVNDYFSELLQGRLSEIEFEAKLNVLIQKYSPDKNLWKKVVTYVKAIVEFITGKDKHRLPALLHVRELREYTEQFGHKFIGYLNSLSEEAKTTFVEKYSQRLEEKMTGSTSESNSPREVEKRSSSSSKSSEGEDSSSHASSKLAPLVAQYRSKAMSLEAMHNRFLEEETNLMSVSAVAG